MDYRADYIRAVMAAGMVEELATIIVDAFLEEENRLREEGRLTPENLEQAWRERKPEVEQIVALKRRRVMLSVIRRNEVLDDIRRAQEAGFDFLDGLNAVLVGRSKRVSGTRQSIAAQYRALFTSWAEPLVRELDELGAEGADGMGKGGVLKLLREDKDFHDAVIIAMREPDAEAGPLVRETVGIVARYVEAARRRFNLAGGDMGRLEGWMPLLHSAEKLLRAGREKWKEEILSRLDRERTFGRAAADAEKVSKMLDGIYETLILGKNPFLVSVSGKSGGKNAAQPLEQPCILHFASGRDAVSYHDRFGSGCLLDAAVRHVDRMARAVTLMERLGPNPEQTVRRLIDGERARVCADKTLDQKTKDGLLRRMDEAMKPGVLSGVTAMRLAELTGEMHECVFPTLAKVAAVPRATQMLNRLGGAVLPAVSDPFLKAAGMRCSGETWPSAITRSLLRYLENGKDEATRRAAAGQAGALLDTLTGSLAAVWDANGDELGKVARMRNWLFRWTNLDWITEQGKAGYALWLSGRLGEVAGHGWDALPPDLRAMLDRHGVDAARWDALRSMSAVAEDGKVYFLPVDVAPDDARLEALLPEDLRREPPADAERAARFAAAREAELARLRERLRTDALALLADEAAFAILEPDDAVRAVFRRRTRRGTLDGEFMRFIMQDKGFPIIYLRRAIGDRCWTHGGRQAGMPGMWFGVRQGIPGVLGFAILAVSFGYASMILKDIAKGRTPCDPRNTETWLTACQQSGGLGIFGDVLLGELSRFGNNLTASLAGPAAGGDDRFLSTMLDNTPFVNMWLFHAGLDYLLLYHLKEWMSPGSLHRMGRRLKKKWFQEWEYELPLSSIIRRAGRLR